MKLWITTLLIFALVLPACAAQRDSSADKSGEDKDKEITLRGRISLRGNRPFSMVMLETTSGATYMLQSKLYQDEFRNLVDMNVTVDGFLRPDLKGDVPLFEVVSYDLRRLASGERPIVGIIVSTRDGVALIEGGSVQWGILGEFSSFFRSYIGAKVWISGVVQQRVNVSRVSYRAIFVTEYGIIRQ